MSDPEFFRKGKISIIKYKLKQDAKNYIGRKLKESIKIKFGKISISGKIKTEYRYELIEILFRDIYNYECAVTDTRLCGHKEIEKK